jgi:hypothetical protein
MIRGKTEDSNSSLKMHLPILVATLTFGSTALAASLVQVSNYNNSAKAKPGMYVCRASTNLFQFPSHVSDDTKVGIQTRHRQK